MADYAIVDGDMVTFLPTFGAATLLGPPPGTITGSGKTKTGGSNLCIEGDEGSVKVENVPYVASPFVGGMGTIVIDSLNNDQLSQTTTSGGTPVILKGTMLTAKFQVKVKGMDTNGVQDPMSEYAGGQGQFINANLNYKAE